MCTIHTHHSTVNFILLPLPTTVPKSNPIGRPDRSRPVAARPARSADRPSPPPLHPPDTRARTVAASVLLSVLSTLVIATCHVVVTRTAHTIAFLCRYWINLRLDRASTRTIVSIIVRLSAIISAYFRISARTYDRRNSDVNTRRIMETDGTSRTLHVLLTGPPGIGKTTVCKKVASTLEKSKNFDGFYTEEVRDRSGSRIGFDIVRVRDPERRLSLARLKNLMDARQAFEHQVGNYRVFLDNFEAVALPVMDLNTDILFVDEIGKMELFSKDFKEKVTDILLGSSKRAFVIGTIPQMHKVPRQHAALFENLHADERIKILNVSRENRNNLPEEIIRFL